MHSFFTYLFFLSRALESLIEGGERGGGRKRVFQQLLGLFLPGKPKEKERRKKGEMLNGQEKRKGVEEKRKREKKGTKASLSVSCGLKYEYYIPTYKSMGARD